MVLKSACSRYTFIAYGRNTKSFWATFAVLATHSPSLGFYPLHSDEEAAGVGSYLDSPAVCAHHSSRVQLLGMEPRTHLGAWLCVAAECLIWMLLVRVYGELWKKITCQIFYVHVNIREGAVCALAASGLLQISLFWSKLSPARIFSEVIPSFTVERWGSRKTNQSSSGFNLPNRHLTYI